jgi:hypothetical protein
MIENNKFITNVIDESQASDSGTASGKTRDVKRLTIRQRGQVKTRLYKILSQYHPRRVITLDTSLTKVSIILLHSYQNV